MSWQPRDKTNGHREGEQGCCPACGLNLHYFADLPAPKKHADGTLRLQCPSCQADLVETERFDLWTVRAWTAQKKRAQETKSQETKNVAPVAHARADVSAGPAGQPATAGNAAR